MEPLTVQCLLHLILSDAWQGCHVLPAVRVLTWAACAVSTENGCRVTAQNIVLASNSPLHHNLAIHSRQTAYRLYVSALKMKEVRP